MDEFNVSKVRSFNRIIFLDRDGTINKSPSKTWVTKLEEFKYINLDFDIFRRISELRFGFVIVTNQRGLSTGDLNLQEYRRINLEIVERFQTEGVNLVSILTCPHSKSCTICRKPNPGMPIYVMKKFQIPSKKCWMIGDKESDAKCAKVAHIPFKLVDNTGDNSWPKLTTNQALEEILLNG